MVVGYFTAGVLLLLGVLLIVKFGREMKLCYVGGGVFVMLGIWWALNTLYPNHPIIDGWLGWAVKIVSGIALAVMAAWFFIVRKREIVKFKEEEELKKNGGKPKNNGHLYDNYDDYKYDDEK